MSFCQQCGHENSFESGKFCTECGAPLPGKKRTVRFVSKEEHDSRASAREAEADAAPRQAEAQPAPPEQETTGRPDDDQAVILFGPVTASVDPQAKENAEKAVAEAKAKVAGFTEAARTKMESVAAEAKAAAAHYSLNRS
ncbi:MAG: zinc ribbon domain-containing protein [Coriobacteriia bacterium]|nr:zinc ribbon domain-containing protein [Coriobacteriia bacterium]